MLAARRNNNKKLSKYANVANPKHIAAIKQYYRRLYDIFNRPGNWEFLFGILLRAASENAVSDR